MPTPPPPEPMPLRVASVDQIATGIFRYDLRRPDGGDLPPFTAGAHVTVWLPNGGTRCFSLANNPLERNRYEIAVKREDTGRGGSKILVDRIRQGDELAVSAPDNWFALASNVSEFLFVAGGIGITPIMAMMRDLNATNAARYKLYYLTRSPSLTPFITELQAPEFAGKVALHHDQGDLERAFDLWPLFERPTAAHVYCCGPQGLMDTVRDMTGHWPTSAIHFESFTNAFAVPRLDDTPFAVRLAKSGDVLTVPAGVSIIDALRAHGCRVPSSCESGTCGTCRTRLLAGEADHRDLVLAPDERAENIMVCVSRAKSAELVLDL
ncbi:MAG TPA: PDR/VanB family oxidoreductase [Casimicrobiaceae bacterium]|jgi:phthalate 4,5-dioxygenase reductase subunit